MKADRQLTALAGEFFVAGELSKRGLQTSVTFGNAKAIDLLAHNPRTRRTFAVQVKTLRYRNYFLVDPRRVEADYVYVFALLNKPGVPVEYYVVCGGELLADPSRFDQHPSLPGIHPSRLEDFRDNWELFEEPSH